MSSEVSTRRQCAVILLLALGFTSLIQTGCTSPVRRLGIVDEIAIAYRDRVWAQRAYNLRFANCDRQYENHFKNGFCAGYAEVCNGGDGYVPAVPPDSYRGYEYQCAEGSRCVDTWFEGFPEGVAAARAEDAGSYHEMHVSRMIDQAVTQAKTPNALPSDIPVSKARSPKIPVGTVAAKAFGAKFKPLLNSSDNDLVSRNSSARKSVANVSNLGSKRFADVANIEPPAPFDRSAKLPTAKLPAAKLPAAKLPAAKLSDAKLSDASTRFAPKPPAALPPIIRSAPQPTTLPPIIRSAPRTTALPAVPTIRGTPVPSMRTLDVPPVVRGRRIDPSANVSTREIPLPMAVRSTFDTRTAAWPVNRR